MLRDVLLQISIVVFCMLVVSTWCLVGRGRLRSLRERYPQRIREVLPTAVILALVLLTNGVARRVTPEISWVIGYEATGLIYALEGSLVAVIQSFEHVMAIRYFSFVYVYGYVFVLIFPVVAYLALEDTRPLRELFAAYALNYSIGLVIYIFVIAYGPRNMMPDLVDGLLYDTYPQTQHLTREVNRNTNVFPSLHTSLAVTVALMAYRTREELRLWYYLAVVLAVSVAVATMYLGIHWATDVVAGTVLAYGSVRLAGHLLDRWSLADVFENRFGERVQRATSRRRE